MSITTSDKLADLHAEMMREFNASYEASWTIREEAKRARRFVDVPGAQWDDWLGEQFQNRPRPEVNKLARAVDRIYKVALKDGLRGGILGVFVRLDQHTPQVDIGPTGQQRIGRRIVA